MLCRMNQGHRWPRLHRAFINPAVAADVFEVIVWTSGPAEAASRTLRHIDRSGADQRGGGSWAPSRGIQTDHSSKVNAPALASVLPKPGCKPQPWVPALPPAAIRHPIYRDPRWFPTPDPAGGPQPVVKRLGLLGVCGPPVPLVPPARSEAKGGGPCQRESSV